MPWVTGNCHQRFSNLFTRATIYIVKAWLFTRHWFNFVYTNCKREASETETIYMLHYSLRSGINKSLRQLNFRSQCLFVWVNIESFVHIKAFSCTKRPWNYEAFAILPVNKTSPKNICVWRWTKCVKWLNNCDQKWKRATTKKHKSTNSLISSLFEMHSFKKTVATKIINHLAVQHHVCTDCLNAYPF